LNVELVQELKCSDHERKLILLQHLLVNKKFSMYTSIDQNGNTLLHMACENGLLSVVRALIEVYGCSLDVVNKFGCTPCHAACEKGRVEIMKYFFHDTHGMSCTLHNNNMETWLHSAVKSGSIQLIRLIVFYFLADQFDLGRFLKLGEFNDDILYQCFRKNKFTKLSSRFSIIIQTDNNGKTPLHVACIYNNLPLIDFFLSELNLVLNFDFTFLIPSLLKLACQLRRKNIIEHLSQNYSIDLAGVQDQAPSTKSLFFFQQRQYSEIPNESAVFYTVRRGDFKFYNKVLRSLTSLKVTNSLGDSLLHAACVSGNLKLLTAIYEDSCRANVNPMTKNLQGNTCLHIACEWGWSKIVKYLIDKKYSINEQNNLGESAIHIAIKKKRKNIFDMLLEKSDLDAINIYGETPLHLATCDPNGMEYVKAILGVNGNSINSQDERGDTPLFNACRNINKKMVLYLLNQSQCEVLTVNKHTNESIATIACRLSWMEILKEIFKKIEHYPNKLQNCMGETLFHIACRKNDLEFVKYLVGLPVLYDYSEDINLLDKTYEQTPLQYGCARNDTELVQYLLDLRGCSPDTKNNNGNTVLHICSTQNLLGVAQTCLRYCSLKIRNEDGNTPLHLACKKSTLSC